MLIYHDQNKHQSEKQRTVYAICRVKNIKTVQKITLSNDSLLLLAVSGSKTFAEPSELLFWHSFIEEETPLRESVAKLGLLTSGEWNMLASWARPIDSNNSLVTLPRFTVGEQILSIAICFERHSESCSAAANCEFSVLYTLCKECVRLHI